MPQSLIAYRDDLAQDPSRALGIGGGEHFLNSEVPLYNETKCRVLKDPLVSLRGLQGYLTYKKPRPPS